MKLYFSEKYAQLYEKHENAVAKSFNYECNYGKLTNVFLEKEIPFMIDNKTYYDICTPYGYGGPRIIETSNAQMLMKEYQKAFKDYCMKERIVSEFIRFHPLENNGLREFFDGEVDYVGPQIIRDLKQPINTNMSKRMMKQYRSNIRKGMTILIDDTGQYQEEFIEMYYSTMNMNKAEDYYYFQPDFFENMHRTLKNHYIYIYICLENKIIAGGLILYGDTYGYGFLVGTRPEYYESSPNINIEIEGMKWLKEKGLSYYLMGGGHKGEDGIYQFKKKFAKDSDYHFHVGKKIHIPEIYNQLILQRFGEKSEDISPSFFPAYRAEISRSLTKQSIETPS